MRFNSIRSYLLASTAALCLAMPAAAGDLKPPSYRYQDLSTVAGWNFATRQDTSAIRPDLLSPFQQIGDAQIPIQPFFPGIALPLGILFGDAVWTSDFGGGYLGGVSESSGITFFVPSWLKVLHPESGIVEQKIRVQVTYLGKQPTVAVKALPGVAGSPKTATSEAIVDLDVPLAPFGSSFRLHDWKTSPASWHMIAITLPAETQLQEVVIDTGSFDHHDRDPLFEDDFEEGDG